jgi:hypothetical protein
MAIPISGLPRIVETLGVDDTVRFVVLAYDEFVTFVAEALPATAPDVVAVLDHRGEHAFAIVLLGGLAEYIKALDIAGTVDERHYLAAHPDVGAAVDQGHLRSGTEHYIISGYFERRAVKFPRA